MKEIPMTMIDMHAHWRPAEIADALRARTREPRIVRRLSRACLERQFRLIPFRQA